MFNNVTSDASQTSPSRVSVRRSLIAARLLAECHSDEDMQRVNGGAPDNENKCDPMFVENEQRFASEHCWPNVESNRRRSALMRTSGGGSENTLISAVRNENLKNSTMASRRRSDCSMKSSDESCSSGSRSKNDDTSHDDQARYN